MDSNRISYLFNQLESNSLSTMEREELYSLLRSFENNDEILAWLEGSYLNTTPQPINTEHWRPILESVLQHKQAKIVPLKPIRRTWIKWVAAACILALVGVLANVYLKKNKTEQAPIATTHDVQAPKETRAVITLANGSKVYLDSVDNGTIAQENSVAIIKTSDGGISYLSPAGGGELNASPNNERPGVVFNTLTNPRGSKVIDMTLSDGSHVWLNSGSSIKYPVAFIGKERIVEITGEAYFEVKHNAKQPFKVHLPNGSIVEDIGTSFNINAYSDEDNIKTTLIEGSVRVTPSSPAGGGGLNASPDRKRPGVDLSVVLKPGQQAVATSHSLLTTSSVDVDEVMAWKNGTFFMKSADISSIMRQVSRWYDVDVVYPNGVPKGTISGEVPRSMSLSDVLKVYELSGVKFRIEGRKIIVTK